MNIGILTQPLGHNYGGILQNWALQQVLLSMGYHPITIDYNRKYRLYRWLFTTCRINIQKVITNNDIICPQKPIKGRMINPITAPFIFKNIILTKPYAHLSPDIIEREKLGAIIVGSDQVWRPKYNNSIEDMFLDFSKNSEGLKRISYAASFGADNWEFSEVQTQKCKNLINRFGSVSVRERSGVILCKEYLGITPECVLDPTLLLSKTDYLALCEREKAIVNRPFLAFYCLDKSSDKVRLALRIAKERELDIIEYSVDESLTLPVPKWLAVFRDADFILTDSYHGTIFSIIFNKHFLSIKNHDRGGSRFDSLLEMLNLKDHLIDETYCNVDFPEIDRLDIDSRLARLKKNSMDFLRNSLLC